MLVAGTAIQFNALLSNQTYVANLLGEFNAAAPGNQMKWVSLQPQRQKWFWDEADEFVGFCERHGLRIKGHTLIWHNQLPPWVTESLSADALRWEMLAHVRTTVARYKGRIPAWDVVNEVIATKRGDASHHGDGKTYRNSLLMRKLGPDFIEAAFRAAHDADPSADLIYNDYNVIDGGDKADRMYEMVRGLLRKGVPLHVVGFQTHVKGPELEIDGWMSQAAANLKRFADLGLKITLSEIDMRISGWPASERRWRQRNAYRALLAMALVQPKMEGLMFWGFTDQHSWIHFKFGADEPLLLDENYRIKPAYHGCCDGALDALLAQRCWENGCAPTAKNWWEQPPQTLAPPRNQPSTLAGETPPPTPSSPQCMLHCGEVSHPWEDQCNWDGCSGCSECSVPPPALPSSPPPPLPQCMLHCGEKSHPWEERCRWDGCSGCSECSVLPQCKAYCGKKSQPWEERCNWDGCGACSECPECKRFCQLKTEPWYDKCSWDGCSGCTECDDLTKAVPAESPGLRPTSTSSSRHQDLVRRAPRVRHDDRAG